MLGFCWLVGGEVGDFILAESSTLQRVDDRLVHLRRLGLIRKTNGTALDSLHSGLKLNEIDAFISYKNLFPTSEGVSGVSERANG